MASEALSIVVIVAPILLALQITLGDVKRSSGQAGFHGCGSCTGLRGARAHRLNKRDGHELRPGPSQDGFGEMVLRVRFAHYLFQIFSHHVLLSGPLGIAARRFIWVRMSAMSQPVSSASCCASRSCRCATSRRYSSVAGHSSLPVQEWRST